MKALAVREIGALCRDHDALLMARLASPGVSASVQAARSEALGP